MSIRRSFSALAFCIVGALSASVPAATEVASLMEKGQQQLDAGELEQALLTFQQVVVEDPTSSVGYTRLGGVRLLRQEYRAGVESFQRAITLDQQNAEAFVGMALAYLHLGQYQLARESLKQAQLLDPAKTEEIERVMAWIDQRSTASTH